MPSRWRICRTGIYPPSTPAGTSPLLARSRSLLAGSSASCILRPCSPLEQGLIISSDSNDLAGGTCLINGSNRLTLPRVQCMADIPIGGLRERSHDCIFNLSLRRRTASSSRGPADHRHRIEPNPPPWVRSNGKRRFLLPRPFATTFIGLQLRLEPLFLPKRFDLPHCKAVHPCK